MDHYTEEQKALLDALSLKAEKLGYAVRYHPTDPARLQLISRHPSFLEEKDLWKQDFYDIRDLADFLAAEASASETRTCWRLQISIAPLDRPYESCTRDVVIEVPARRDDQSQGLAYEQATSYIEKNFGGENSVASAIPLPSKTTRPGGEPKKTDRGFDIWID